MPLGIGAATLVNGAVTAFKAGAVIAHEVNDYNRRKNAQQMPHEHVDESQNNSTNNQNPPDQGYHREPQPQKSRTCTIL